MVFLETTYNRYRTSKNDTNKTRNFAEIFTQVKQSNNEEGRNHGTRWVI